MDPAGRKELVELKGNDITVKRQCELVSVHRTSVYNRPCPKEVDEDTLFIMKRIDEIHTAHPTWGSRTIKKIINRNRDKDRQVNRKRIQRLMRLMGLNTLYPKPNLSKRYHKQYVRPYLLRNLDIARPDQVWGVDITYIRMEKGFMYLFIIIDWYSRCIVDYELSSTLEKDFVMNCLKRSLARTTPEIINCDQGSHFTNPDYISLLEKHNVKISMDGKGQALDNVRTERFFRTLKYDLIYINDFDSPRQLRRELNKYMIEYNTYRPHSSIDDRCPMEAYTENTLQKAS